MLDPKQLKVGSVVRMEGNVTYVNDKGDVVIDFSNRGLVEYQVRFLNNMMQHAELVSTPVSYSNAQIEDILLKAIEIMGREVTGFRVHELEDYLRSHEDKSRLE